MKAQKTDNYNSNNSKHKISTRAYSDLTLANRKSTKSNLGQCTIQKKSSIMVKII